MRPAGGAVEGPWALPAGWRWERLGDVLPLFYGKGLTATERQHDGNVPVYSSAGITGCHDVALCPEPSIIVGRKGSAGSIYYAPGPSFTIDTAYYCPLSKAGMDLQLGFYLLCFLDLKKLDQSTAVPSLSRDSYDEVIVSVPRKEIQAPLAKRIDELFADLDDGEAALARARADLGTWRKALLKAAVTGELTADWRAANPPTETGADLLARILSERRARWHAQPRNEGKRYVEPEEPSTGEFPALPIGWVWTTVGALLQDGIQNGLYLPQSAYGGTIPIMRIDDFQAASAQPSSMLRRVVANEEIQLLYSLRVGDYILNRVNSLSHLGKSFLVREQHVPALFESNMMRMRPSDLIEKAFLELYLSCEIGRGRICRNAKAAVNQASINQTDVSQTPVPLPPNQEQIAIVNSVNDASKTDLEGEFKTLSAATSMLRQSILAAAFRGDLVA